ncbi:dihydrofolate reductase [Paenibacillus wulumuqiensis]|uniref:dihydrofolate reductase n=1 Tax=Paenibacillus wulumuqiensis TaxID=1567107 RepID=UPI000619B9A6|nr:dihydrofolate reductase [Paenibacillus wulumuqiensis]
MTITLIWAQARQGVIGKDNDMPWKLPRDMAYFKQQTQQKTIVMGRKTWNSFGSKPLPNRRNIILTRDTAFEAEQAEVVHSVEEALRLAGAEEEVMIIGGSQIYKEFLSHADRLLVTRIEHDFEGDTYFPEVDWSTWELVNTIPGVRDEKNDYDYRFEEYRRV